MIPSDENMEAARTFVLSREEWSETPKEGVLGPSGMMWRRLHCSFCETDFWSCRAGHDHPAVCVPRGTQ
jgi:hypothetical protein